MGWTLKRQKKIIFKTICKEPGSEVGAPMTAFFADIKDSAIVSDEPSLRFHIYFEFA